MRMTRPSPASSPAFVSLLCTGGFGTRIRLRRSSRVITLISGIFRLYSCCMPMLCIIFFEYCINCPGVDSLKSIPDMKAWRRRDIVSRFLNNLSKILLTILVYVFLLEYGLSDAFVGTNKAAEESKNMRNPLRKDYADDDAGQQAYLGALKTSSEKQRKVGTEMTDTASGQANTLKNTETTLKAVKDVADTTLSVASVVVPGAGTALNAVVKGVEAGLEAKDGNYLNNDI